MNEGINTFPRYLYLNAYAFLLIFLGVGIAFFALWFFNWWLVAMVAIPCCYSISSGTRILGSWNGKKRSYQMLMERNSDATRPDTFSDYMQAPCGRLLAKIVLKDLGREEEYLQLKKLQKTYWTGITDRWKKNRGAILVYRRNPENGEMEKIIDREGR